MKRPPEAESIRLRLLAGLLPPLHGGAWTRPATGQLCVVCDQEIRRPDLECELELPQPTFAHVQCFTLWFEESRRLIG